MSGHSFPTKLSVTGVAVGVDVGGAGVSVGVAVGVTVGVGVSVGGTGVSVGVAVGGTGVSVGVAVGGTGVSVGVAVGGTGVSVGVAVGVAVAVAVGVDVAPLHVANADRLLRGTGPVTTSKSTLLLSVSWQPLCFLTAPCWLVSDTPLFTSVPPSPLFEIPYDTRSTILESGSTQSVAVAPQPRVVVTVARAIFPFEPLMLRFVVVASGVTGRFAPPAPTVPSCTR